MSDEKNQIRELIRTLNDDPDELHLDITPAVRKLANHGLAIIPYLEEPLMSDDEMTRLHAQRALEMAVSHHHGFRPGKGFEQPDGAELVRRLFEQNGRYDFESAADQRRQVVDTWLRWYASLQE